jgi:hypothetical protein
MRNSPRTHLDLKLCLDQPGLDYTQQTSPLLRLRQASQGRKADLSRVKLQGRIAVSYI